MQTNDYALADLQDAEGNMEELGCVDAQSILSIFFQSGYLTIKGYNDENETYSLGYPNLEVEKSFAKSMVPWLLPTHEKINQFNLAMFIDDIRCGRPKEFMQRMQWLFDDSSYQIMGRKEVYFQNCIYLVFKLLSYKVQVERATTRGRIDITVRTPGYAYVIECKIDSTPDAALAQIEQMGYAVTFEREAAAGMLKKVFKIGVNFSTQKRTLDGWKIVGRQEADD